MLLYTNAIKIDSLSTFSFSIFYYQLFPSFAFFKKQRSRHKKALYIL